MDRKKAKLFRQWEICWQKEKGEKENLEIFSELFRLTYESVEYKKDSNKKKNSRWKLCFMLVLVAGIVTFTALAVEKIINKESVWMELMEGGLFLLVFILAGGVVSKWLDIKKYQETWARHSGHLHRMEREMLLFVSGLEPYHKKGKKEIFAKNIIGLWDANQEKFVGNMEEKEKELMDIYEKLKLK